MDLNKENLNWYMKNMLERLDNIRGSVESTDAFNSYSNQMNLVELMIEEIEDIFE